MFTRAQERDREGLRQLELAVGENLACASEGLDVRIRDAMIDQLKVKTSLFLLRNVEKC